MSHLGKRSLQVYVAYSEEEMLQFPAFPGDQCRREDVKRNYMLARLPASEASNWSLVSVYSTDFALNYELSDWQPVGDHYELIVDHGLGTKLINATAYDAQTGKIISYESSIDSPQYIVLLCPALPDGRKAIVVAIVGITL